MLNEDKRNECVSAYIDILINITKLEIIVQTSSMYYFEIIFTWKIANVPRIINISFVYIPFTSRLVSVPAILVILKQTQGINKNVINKTHNVVIIKIYIRVNKFFLPKRIDIYLQFSIYKLKLKVRLERQVKKNSEISFYFFLETFPFFWISLL